MTGQIANSLINECTEVDFNDLNLYAVLVGDIKNGQNIVSYPFKQKATQEKLNVFTACWNGYTSRYKITKSKELVLTGFEYPALLPEKKEPDETHEVAIWNFWLDMRPGFFDGFIYVPFKDGKLITDKKEWIFCDGMSKKEPVELSYLQRFLMLFKLNK